MANITSFKLTYDEIFSSPMNGPFVEIQKFKDL